MVVGACPNSAASELNGATGVTGVTCVMAVGATDGGSAGEAAGTGGGALVSATRAGGSSIGRGVVATALPVVGAVLLATEEAGVLCAVDGTSCDATCATPAMAAVPTTPTASHFIATSVIAAFALVAAATPVVAA